MTSKKRKETDLQGFCPKAMGIFFVGAEVVFGGHRDLQAALEYLTAGNTTLAVSSIKVCRYRPNQPRALLFAVERQIYASICPYINT